jgi:hypothetical protein
VRADDRDRTGDLHLGKVARCPLRHVRMRAAGRHRTCGPLTRQPLSHLSYGGAVSSARFERTLASISGWCLCRWATRTQSRSAEPQRGAAARSRSAESNRGPPAYEAGALASELQRLGWDTRLRTWTLRVQGPAGLPVPPYPIEYGRRDLNPHELALTKV